MNKNIIHKKSKKIVYTLLILVILSAVAVYFAPYFLDDSSPLLIITGIEQGKSYSKILKFVLNAEDESTKIGYVSVQIDNRKILQKYPKEKCIIESLAIDLVELRDGEHILVVEVIDRAFRHNTTVDSIIFIADNTAPTLEIRAIPANVKQGNTLALFVKSNEPLSELFGELFDRDIVFYPNESDNKYYRSLIGVSVQQKIKKHRVEIVGIDIAGNHQTIQYNITVRKTNFERGTVNLPKSKTALLTDTEARSIDRKKIKQSYSTKISHQFWDGKSIRPAKGWISSSFGKRRVYNNGMLKSIHSGLDIANKVGTPVKAINSGIITLADTLPIHGITVVINHGQGVYSIYSHLSKVNVNFNEKVKSGQLIGLIGDTGQSTGPHLHWEIKVNGISVNPEEWQNRDFEYP